MQNFPVFQGLRQNDNAANSACIVPEASAVQDFVVAPAVEHRQPVQNIHEAADAEELLKELDACGVSGLNVLASRSLYYTHMVHRLFLFSPVMQVGFIASLKNEHSHEVVEQASWLFNRNNSRPSTMVQAENFASTLDQYGASLAPSV